MSKAKLIARWCLLVCLLAVGSRAAWAQTTMFSYQGKLTDAGNPANGVFDLQFKLFDALSAGAQQGATVTLEDVIVSSGVFTVQLDFGAAFPGAARFLEISVRPGASIGAFTLLTPRQPIQATPYAIRSLLAGTAAQANSLAGCVACVTSDQIGSVSGSAVTGAIPVASVPAGSGNYVQNTTTQQASSNFNISGNGTAGGTLSGNIVNATTQYKLGGQAFLSSPGSGNLFAGLDTGGSTPGSGNTFVGNSIGVFNSAGGNSFFGNTAGTSNTTGSDNSFFGSATGISNTTGSSNAYFGVGAGAGATTGSANTFVGAISANANTTGGANTALGFRAEVGTANSNATAIGFRASAACSNCLVLGSISGVNNATSNINVGIGTTSPSERLHVVGNGLITGNLTVSGTLTATLPAGSANYIQNTTSPQASSNFNISGNGTAGGTLSGNIVSATTQYNLNGVRVLANPGSSNLFAGAGAGVVNATGFSNAFFGSGAGNFNSSGSNNAFFGASAGLSNLTGFNNAFFGSSAGFNSTGIANAFFGFNAGFANTAGANNAFFGAGAGDTNVGGSNNSFFGSGAGDNTNSSNNTFIGGLAGASNTTGSQNTALGASAEVSTTNTNATAIGYRASAACSNCVVLGSVNGANGATGNIRVGIGTINPSATLEVRDSTANTGRIQVGATAVGSDEKLIVFGDSDNGTCGGPCVYLGERTVDDRMELRAASFMFRNGPVTPGADGTQNLGSLTLRWNTVFATNGVINTSDARLKQNVTPMRYGLRELLRLRPVSFEWKANFDGRTHLGLLAQEAETVIPESVVRDADPAAPLGMSYTDLIPVVIKSIQEQQAALTQKEQAIQLLVAQNDALQKRLESVERALHRKTRPARRR